MSFTQILRGLEARVKDLIIPTEESLCLDLASSFCVFTDYFGRIFHIPKLGAKLKQDSIPLSYTPRKFITHPQNNYFYMVESDHRVIGDQEAAKRLDELVSSLCISDNGALTSAFLYVAKAGSHHGG